jgi:UDP-glucose 4-epimerase
MRQFKAGEALTIDGDGEQTRDFTHVKDVVSANIAAMHSPKVGAGEVVNIGNGERYSVNYIAEKISPTIIRRESPRGKGDARDTQADITLTQQLLSWHPEIRFEQGLASLLREEGIEPIQ